MIDDATKFQQTRTYGDKDTATNFQLTRTYTGIKMMI